MCEKEEESLYITLKTLFEEVSREASLIGKISLISLANKLSLTIKGESYSLKELSSTFYWLSFLIYWKAEWFFSSSSTQKLKDKISKNQISQKLKKKPLLAQEVESLVLYLEHKTFKSLALSRKESKKRIAPLKEDHLREIYSNLKKEKEKKESLSHIDIQEPTTSSFLFQWEDLLLAWDESISLNRVISSFNVQEKTLAFMDILQRQKKGELEIFQPQVNTEIFLRKLKKESLKSYG